MWSLNHPVMSQRKASVQWWGESCNTPANSNSRLKTLMLWIGRWLTWTRICSSNETSDDVPSGDVLRVADGPKSSSTVIYGDGQRACLRGCPPALYSRSPAATVLPPLLNTIL